MSKIAPDHLARAAFVYVRQSTAYQVADNLESQRRQYALVERARQLGWNDVQLIDCTRRRNNRPLSGAYCGRVAA